MENDNTFLQPLAPWQREQMRANARYDRLERIGRYMDVAAFTAMLTLASIIVILPFVAIGD